MQNASEQKKNEWNQFVKDAGNYYVEQSIFPNAQEDMSNQWVVTPERTADNALYILCDPHLPFNGLTASWSAHLKSLDGNLNYNGFYFIGSPHPVMGHNEHFAWSHTANKPDFADAYIVSLDPNNEEHYLLDGISKPFNIWTEIISFANGTEQQVTMRQSSDHGVFVKNLNSNIEKLPPIFDRYNPTINKGILSLTYDKHITKLKSIPQYHKYQ